MKRFCIIMCFLAVTVAPLSAQVGFELPLNKIKGVSLGYSYRPVFLLGTHTGTTMYPLHTLLLNLDGIINSMDNSSYSNNAGFFGGLGVVVGFSASNGIGSINSKDRYYSSYRRISALSQKTGDMMLLGGDLRCMVLLPFSAEASIIDSYFDFDLEAGYMGLNYEAISGGFNNYVTKKISENGFYCGLNLGVKIFMVEVYGGIGGLFDFYNKGIALEVKDKDIANPPKTTKHFLGQLGVGVVFDLHSMEDM